MSAPPNMVDRILEEQATMLALSLCGDKGFVSISEASRVYPGISTSKFKHPIEKTNPHIIWNTDSAAKKDATE
jgi:hypothetical protein